MFFGIFLIFALTHAGYDLVRANSIKVVVAGSFTATALPVFVIAGESLKDGIYRVDEMVEKPDAADAPSNLAIIGRYILTPDIFDIIRDTPPGANGAVQLTDALQTQARKGCVMAYKFQGRRFDCGSVPGFVEATNFVYENYYGKD